MSFTPQLNNTLKLFRARIAKFSKFEAGAKELCLLLNVEELDPQTNQAIHFREHLWVDVTPTKVGNPTKIRKSNQGDYILFYGRIYEYSTSNLKTQKGIELKFPQCYKYSSIVIKGKYKFLEIQNFKENRK